MRGSYRNRQHGPNEEFSTPNRALLDRTLSAVYPSQWALNVKRMMGKKPVGTNPRQSSWQSHFSCANVIQFLHSTRWPFACRGHKKTPHVSVLTLLIALMFASMLYRFDQRKPVALQITVSEDQTRYISPETSPGSMAAWQQRLGWGISSCVRSSRNLFFGTF